MRDFIELFINGNRYQVRGDRALWTLSDYLRRELSLVGTKIVCSEGDCGACTVLVGRRSEPDSALQYQAVDSCIVFMHQLDRTHVISVEGLSDGKQLTAVQQAMVDCHGSQCGYCTPGFVVAMHGLLETSESDRLSDESLRLGLSGNLCRCTGYRQIIDAGRAVNAAEVPRMNDQYPAESILDSFASLGDTPIEIHAGNRSVFVPQSLAQAIAYKADHAHVRIVTGATDIGVQHNHGHSTGAKLMCVNGVPELTRIVTDSNAVTIGASATWSDVLDAVRGPFPEFAEVLLRFGSPQIRNFGTLGGNLANASPIADSIPFLYVIDAKLKLTSTRGSRQVSINDFYSGYKQLEMESDEIIEAVRCPLPETSERIKLYKVSKRRDMDISTFTAAFLLDIRSGTVDRARIALGGVGPTVLRTPKAEASLVGKSLSLSNMQQAGMIARTEITPISDVRGSDKYRSQLAENIFAKCFYDLAAAGGTSGHQESVAG